MASSGQLVMAGRKPHHYFEKKIRDFWVLWDSTQQNIQHMSRIFIHFNMEMLYITALNSQNIDY